MKAAPDLLSDVEAALRPNGLFVRGVAAFGEDEGPLLSDGTNALSVVLVGNIGGSLWVPFDRWRKGIAGDGIEHPLDNWSKIVIGTAASRFGATAYFPSDPPYQPFQQWAKRAEGLQASPLGILIHPQYGLWHGYRGALGFPTALPASARPGGHPCESCYDKPCLITCPVGAVRLDGFNVGDCRGHLTQAAGQAGCMAQGCHARNACPIGSSYRYPEGQIRFHMQALDLPAV